MNNSIDRWIKIMKFGRNLGCHQLPDRSFFIKGYQFPVCARCTGVIAGELIALVMLCFSLRIDVLQCLIMLIPMGIDWGLQFIKFKESTNCRRLVSGVIAGLGLTYIYYYVIRFIVVSIVNYVC